MKTFFLSLTIGSTAIFLAGCSSQGQITINNNQASSSSGGVIAVQKLQELMPTGKQLVDPTHGKEEGLAYGAMGGANGMLANGVVTAHYFQDGSTIIGLQVNIADAKAGTYYNAWLMNDDGSQPINLGQLENSPGDVRHSLHFESKDNLQVYRKVAVTIQQTGGSQTPGQTVASGTLQTTSR